MGSDAMIYIPTFIKIDSGIQKLIGVIHIQIHTQTQRQQDNLISLLLVFQNKEIRLNGHVVRITDVRIA
jgi:hypothetical protein